MRLCQVFLTSKTSVRIPDETLFRVFDIASQSIDNNNNNLLLSLEKFLHSSDFLCFSHELLMNLIAQIGFFFYHALLRDNE